MDCPIVLHNYAWAAVLRAAAKIQLYHTAIKKSIANLHKLSILKILKFVQYSDLRILKNFCIIYLQGKGKEKTYWAGIPLRAYESGGVLDRKSLKKLSKKP